MTDFGRTLYNYSIVMPKYAHPPVTIFHFLSILAILPSKLGFLYDFGVGGLGFSQNFEIFLRVSDENLEKSGGFTWSPRRGFARGSGQLWRSAPQPTSAAGKPLQGAR